MPQSTSPRSRKNGKYHRARLRRFLFTIGPNKLSGGRIRRRHLGQEVVVREFDVFSPLWPSDFDGLRIGHVSDFHLGELLPLDRALEIVERLALLEPDLIACTGDIVDLDHDHAGPLLEALAHAGAPLGAALVLGNHDELHCPRTILKLADRAGVLALDNEIAQVKRNGKRLNIGGIRWSKSAIGCARQVDETCDETVHLLLSHNPKAFLRAIDLQIPLTLAGHTHGGQIALRNRRNACLALSHRHRAGLFESGASRLYVTSGVGAWFPLRVNCPAEIAMLTMRHGQNGTR